MAQNNASLTPPIALPTSIPFPSNILVKSADGKTTVTQRVLSDTEKIIVSVCSEFTSHVAPVANADGRHRLAILQDTDGNPLILSIGTDNRLYCARHIAGNDDGWKAIDITPIASGGQVYHATTFDANQDMNTNNINLVVAVTLDANIDTGMTDVFSITNMRLPASDADLTGLNWVSRPANLGPRHISALRVTQATSVSGTSYPFAIAGTTESDKLRASDYLISLNPSNTAPWSQDPLAKVATKVIALEPAQLRKPFGQGAFTLFQDAGYAEKYSSFGPDGGDSISYQSFPTPDDPEPFLVPLQLAKIGNVAYDICPLSNSRSETDLIVAGAAGIGYYTAAAMDQAPTVILPQVSFQQVVAAQADTHISILASSIHGELYYVEGTRTSPLAVPTFSSSGMPIRTGIQLISVQRNKTLSCTECTYIDQSGVMKHLWKDPFSGCWSEQVVRIVSPEAQTSTPSYVTHISLANSKGSGVPNGYKVGITSSEVSYVLINEKTHTLDSKPTDIETDNTGVITIVYPVDSTLGCPDYTIFLQEGDAKDQVTAFPAQRVLRALASVKSADDLKQATNTKGEPVFSNLSSDQSDSVSALLSQLGSIITTILPDAAKQLGNDIADAGKDLWVEISNDAGRWHVSSSGDKSWIDKAVDFFQYVGDFFENAGQIVKDLVRFGIRVAESVVEFFLVVGGQVLKFAMKTLAMAVRSLAVFLKNTLGIDISGFLDWLGFIFDWDNILATQRVLANYVQNGFNLITSSLAGNKPFFAQIIADARSAIATAIPDYRYEDPDLTGKSDDSSTGSAFKEWFGEFFDIVFNNPILKSVLNILSKILGGITGLVTDTIEVPGLTKIFNILWSVVLKSFGAAATGVVEFIHDIYLKVQSCLSGDITIAEMIKEILSDAFWEMFDLISGAILAAFDAASELVGALCELLTGAWKIPLITSIWKFLTSTDLTIVNVITIPAALVMNIVSISAHGKLPYQGVYPDPSTTLPSLDSWIMKTPSSGLMSTSRVSAAAPRGSKALLSSSATPDEFDALASTDLKATDEESSENTDKLRQYRRADAICGTVGAGIGLITGILETWMAQAEEQPDNDLGDIELEPMNHSGTIDYSLKEEDPVGRLVHNHVVGGSGGTPMKNKILMATKFALAATSLLTHGASLGTLVALGDIIPEPRRSAWVSLKSIGIALNVIALGVQTGGMIKFPQGSGGRNIALLISGVMYPVSNIFQTSITGFWEFGLSGKEGWDAVRFLGDSTEFLANAAGIVGAVSQFADAEVVHLGAVVAEGTSTLIAIIDLGVLDNAYQNDKGLEET